MGEPVLSATKLVKRFAGVTAVDGVSLEVAAGEVLGLIGPNGAGKSTLFNLLAGTLEPDAGHVRLRGRDVTRLPPHRRAALGLARTFQISRELERLTVLENVMLASPGHPGETLRGLFLRPGQVAARERAVAGRARDLLAEVGLYSHRHALANELSGGQKKLLELARCLMADAEIILLDEAGAGVAPAMLDQICTTVERLNGRDGRTFIVIEHNLRMIERLAGRILVLSQGRVLRQGAFEAIVADKGVIEAYLGAVA